MSKGRYEILVKDGRKIIQRHYFDDYVDSQDMLDELEDTHSRYSVEYTDLLLYKGQR